ncbi:putative 3-deoxy-D-manno-octulosonic-acid transferase [Vibrio nigripulchritudo SFn27]|uniref:3-deoxy-D-manno-octulosonic acid transferase n=1 Tax=Vibrio nigripulchritudo TaxID=28173 RepID=U4KAB9_9VIBR|nr:lipid IV(A) 3-deoxy-D-manno-octulosonic acid transferase [Vibrio nigripulchritudo]CCN80361.1 putative 3-deoxy-D-manno-octulosonic-acid transferase [Vibrio nigripulchritudo BLFn1]CCN91285.1 putative 3-deoxy-D-manno-octulosonic-acid transferase [Vibrio nigripulchritudo SFn27]CCN92630.1 putative 3-deoxy-D-manno-octulosonic-acid transferase [Vibrio nigripulchritudo ENn2]CCO41034.1 putative 3-deoxy-D-manno-octulosonic-acid transferase [Vibrio nigripulchritudo SFn135]CCO50579.1 putative 3-deoxy-D
MIVRALYTFILAIAAPFLLYGLFKKRSNKPSVGKRWKEHIGFTPKLNFDKQPIWIHAVSVGEVLAVTPFIKELNSRKPETPILLTTTTPTGAEQAEKLSAIATHRYMPIDFGFAVKRFLKVTNPSKMIIVETELWPNTLHTVGKTGIPISVLNARLSDKSRRGYQKVPPLFNEIGKNLTKVLCQHQEDADNFRKLGVSKEKLFVTGSIKFDITVSDEIIQAGNLLREQIGQDRPVWIAASTHQGEDEQVLNAHKEILKKLPDAALILVPRHPERFDAVSQLVANEGFSFSRRTSTDHLDSKQVYIGDTMGEMLTLMQAADVCFMGGSLIGDKVGGHNLLEPSALGKPTIIGPSFYNFLDITKQLETVGVTHIVQDSAELADTFLELVSSKGKIDAAKNSAICFCQKNRGALERSFNALIAKEKEFHG